MSSTDVVLARRIIFNYILYLKFFYFFTDSDIKKLSFFCVIYYKSEMEDDIADVFGGSKASGYIRLMMAKKKGMKPEDYAPEKKAREKKSDKYEICKQDFMSANVLKRFGNKYLKNNAGYPTDDDTEKWLYARGPNYLKRSPEGPEYIPPINPAISYPDECLDEGESKEKVARNIGKLFKQKKAIKQAKEKVAKNLVKLFRKKKVKTDEEIPLYIRYDELLNKLYDEEEQVRNSIPEAPKEEKMSFAEGKKKYKVKNNKGIWIFIRLLNKKELYII
jgi:hypothetical protein